MTVVALTQAAGPVHRNGISRPGLAPRACIHAKRTINPSPNYSRTRYCVSKIQNRCWTKQVLRITNGPVTRASGGVRSPPNFHHYRQQEICFIPTDLCTTSAPQMRGVINFFSLPLQVSDWTLLVVLGVDVGLRTTRIKFESCNAQFIFDMKTNKMNGDDFGNMF